MVLEGVVVHPLEFWARAVSTPRGMERKGRGEGMTDLVPGLETLVKGRPGTG